jgi:hypothetical protein
MNPPDTNHEQVGRDPVDEVQIALKIIFNDKNLFLILFNYLKIRYLL